MIKRFNNFLLENLKNELTLILEGYIEGSGAFLVKLEELSKGKDKTSRIAYDILGMIEDCDEIDDNDIKQNFFDLTDKDDMVSFIQQSKIDAMDDFPDDDDVLYNMKGRGEIKIGRIIKYLCNLVYTKSEMPSDKDIEQFVNVFKASGKENKGIEFRLVSGEDISKYYDGRKYYTDHGTLGGSCMADEGPSYFDIYVENPDKVRLLIYVDGKDLIHGRALVWKLDKSPCEAKYFMDRIYTNADSDTIKFKKYAEEQNWMYKKYQRSWVDDGVQFIYQGKEVFGEIEVSIKDGVFEEYPFLDTFCFLSPEKKLLSNLSDVDFYYLKDTDGGCYVCDTCDGKMNYKCDECDGTGKMDCWDCDGEGEYRCDACDGDGGIDCDKCDGDGKIDCDECEGMGSVPGKKKSSIKCKKCKGKGLMDCDQCDGTGNMECDECDGKGELECERCKGTGKQQCDECDGKETLCVECSKGHSILAGMGIETKHNKTFVKRKK